MLPSASPEILAAFSALFERLRKKSEKQIIPSSGGDRHNSYQISTENPQTWLLGLVLATPILAVARECMTGEDRVVSVQSSEMKVPYSGLPRPLTAVIIVGMEPLLPTEGVESTEDLLHALEAVIERPDVWAAFETL